MPEPAAVRAPKLAAWLSSRMGAAVEVTALTRIAEGHSRSMERAELLVDGRPDAVVVRTEQGGVFGTSSHGEYRVMAALHAAGLPVARVRLEEPTGEVLGQPFFVMDWVEGHGGAGTREEALAIVAAVHRLHGAGSVSGLPFEPVASAREATIGQVRRWTSVYRAAVERPVPLLEEAEAWLVEHAPDGVLALVHGDAGPRNVLFADGTAGRPEIAALTDFEFCHLGDVAEDWTFCATMRGRHVMDTAGWAEVIEQVTGWRMDEAGWRYWEAFNHLKGASANLTALKVFRDGTNPAPNMLIVGTTLHQVFLRRVAELVG